MKLQKKLNENLILNELKITDIGDSLRKLGYDENVIKKLNFLFSGRNIDKYFDSDFLNVNEDLRNQILSKLNPNIINFDNLDEIPKELKDNIKDKLIHRILNNKEDIDLNETSLNNLITKEAKLIFDDIIEVEPSQKASFKEFLKKFLGKEDGYKPTSKEIKQNIKLPDGTLVDIRIFVKKYSNKIIKKIKSGGPYKDENDFILTLENEINELIKNFPNKSNEIKNKFGSVSGFIGKLFKVFIKYPKTSLSVIGWVIYNYFLNTITIDDVFNKINISSDNNINIENNIENLKNKLKSDHPGMDQYIDSLKIKQDINNSNIWYISSNYETIKIKYENGEYKQI